ncbi:MAG: ammonia-forming cytochrome c nitrite reductase subunit c552 [Myxococcales bacterium]|nr:ammonia-forming cytochrome c nitrite reductase subunit c552 [Myxococcales bacterium]
MKSNYTTFRFLLILLAAAAGAFVATAVLVDIFEKKQEGTKPFFTVVAIDDDTADPAVWGKNFPLQYDSYLRTTDMERTKWGGSESVRKDPTPGDPRSVTSQSKIEEDGQLKRMWLGYGFSKDFREERGHAYMLEDQTFTKRTTEVKQPGTCANCHASMYTVYKELGDGDIQKGFDAVNALPYAEAKTHLEHPVSCIDCHDAKTMALRVTRPAFMTGIKAIKAREGVTDYDVNRDASRAEMRSYVCGQCHVEYYFEGDAKTLTYPWTKGVRADDILAYYDEAGFKDWVHAETGAPMLKAQHPEFELWSQGTHASAGVACADCHMPYERVGAMKVSSHHVRSPLLDVQSSCQTCHRVDEKEILARAETIQDRFRFSRDLAFDALMDLIDGIKAAKDGGASPSSLVEAQDRQRKASFLIDFVEAENSTGFHADQEAVRVLTLALDHIRRGQLALVAASNRETASNEL